MAILSVSVPEDLKHKMEILDEVNWSAVARKAFEEKVIQITFLKKIASKSKLTNKDADKISKEINQNIAKKFKVIN